MKPLILVIALSFTIGANAQKRDSINSLSQQWKADSNGTLGLRIKCIQRVHTFYDVFGTYIIGYSKEQLFNLLGNPSYVSTEAPVIGDEVFTDYFYILDSTNRSYFVVSIDKNRVTTTKILSVTNGVKVK